MKNTCSKTTTFRKKGKHITDSERQIIIRTYSERFRSFGYVDE